MDNLVGSIFDKLKKLEISDSKLNNLNRSSESSTNLTSFSKLKTTINNNSSLAFKRETYESSKCKEDNVLLKNNHPTHSFEIKRENTCRKKSFDSEKTSFNKYPQEYHKNNATRQSFGGEYEDKSTEHTFGRKYLPNSPRHTDGRNYKDSSAKNSFRRNYEDKTPKYAPIRIEDRSGRYSLNERKSKNDLNNFGDNIRSNVTHEIFNSQSCRLGYKKLEELEKDEPLKIAVELANTHNQFGCLLKKSVLEERPDWIILISKLLVKVCQCEFPGNKIKVLTLVFESEFVELVEEFLKRVSESSNKKKYSPTKESLDLFLNNILGLLETLINMFQYKAKERFHNSLKMICLYIVGIENFVEIILDDIIKNKFTKIENQLKNMKCMFLNISDKKYNSLDKSQPPDDFRSIPSYPSHNEILRDTEVFLRKAVVEGSYDNINHYLDVQFRLLRQDFVQPIRSGFKELFLTLHSEEKRKTRVNNVRLFNRCRFQNIETYNGKLAYTVCFDLDRKLDKVMWEYNKWFMFGSLLFFSFDNFSSFFMGTVCNKKTALCQKERIISVELIGSTQLTKKEFAIDMIMVESSIFFQPYYHVMNALKLFNESNFPMSQYIVEVNSVIKSPTYLGKQIQLGDTTFDPLIDSLWPTPDKLQLDKYQFQAFKSALTKEFVIIQGPPGTGKTYLGLKIVETILKNSQVNKLQSPIMLVCYTNHALDQFLEGILKFTNSIVRFGSQSKSEMIKPYELKQVRTNFNFKIDQALNSAFLSMKNQLKDIVRERKSLEVELKIIEEVIGIIDFKLLEPFMSDNHKKQLKTNVEFIQWLFMVNFSIKEETFEFCSLFKNHYEIANSYTLYEEDSEDEDKIINQAKNENLLEELFSPEDRMKLLKRSNIHSFSCDLLNQEIFKIEDEKEKTRFYDENEIEDWFLKLRRLKELNTKLEKQWKIRPKYSEHKDCSKDASNLMKKNFNERWALYWQWVMNLKTEIIDYIQSTEKEYQQISGQYLEVRQLQDIRVILQHKIFGTTTTKAAEYYAMLSALKPKIVIVEEAAEVLEAHIVTTLTSHCEHLILIGDHKQLRPNPTVYELAKKYNLEISLFERMIKNKLSYSTLRVQHRMRPEICDLITPSIYLNLENHISVLNYENVKGVTKNMFFVSHEVQEVKDEMLESHKNPHEGDFLMKLAEYFILQGYTSDQITILVTYSAQLIYLKQLKKRLNIEALKNIRLTTVDNYQGEECHIILLSFVRSNLENKIGFLSTQNRVCVALSRAKIGLFMIGNMACLEKNNEIWPAIKLQLEIHKAIGPDLELQCQIHKVKTLVSCHSDFFKVAAGGCSILCNRELQCGHLCKSLCHPTDQDHKFYNCPEKCTKTCPIGHPCNDQCYQKCNPCRVLVSHKLNCGHTIQLPCHTDVETHLCKEKVQVQIKPCDHKIKVPCYHAKASFKCPLPCLYRLQCGHSCSIKCHVTDDPDHINYKCKKKCVKKNKGCSLEHSCKQFCFEDCKLCDELVSKKLPCEHQMMVECHTEIDSIECNNQCNRTLLCGHPCKKKCKEVCGDCNTLVEKKIPICGHTVRIECMTNPEKNHCHSKCETLLSCGHVCSQECRSICSAEKCDILVDAGFESDCGHPGKIMCKSRWEERSKKKASTLKNCSEPCQEQLLCGHVCKGTCGGCKQGRLHEICKEKCGRNQICGHSCNISCSDLCPPCYSRCITRCSHSVCNKPCGIDCDPCEEDCAWKCPHLQCEKKCSEICIRKACQLPCLKVLICGHSCIGFCGEPCPTKCRICDKEEVTEIFFGTEEEEEARFVVLEDCGHFFESVSLENYLRLQADPSDLPKAIVMLTCPKCRIPIMSTLRYMNLIRPVLADIAKVKKMINKSRPSVVQLKLDTLSKLAKLQKRHINDLKTFSVIVENIRENIQDYYIQNVEGKTMQRIKYVSNDEMNIYVFIVEFLENITEMVLSLTSITLENKSLLFEELEKLLQFVRVTTLPQKKVSQQQQFDLSCELRRSIAFTNLLKIKNKNGHLVNQPNLVELYDKCLEEILCIKKFDPDRTRHVNKLIEHLIEELHLIELKTAEFKMIYNAMKPSFRGYSQQGHFFKCPNGHYYCITECGGAMELSKCPDCNATIGGENHRYVAGTRVATEIDGATSAAWPGTIY